MANHQKTPEVGQLSHYSGFRERPVLWYAAIAFATRLRGLTSTIGHVENLSITELCHEIW